MKVLANLLNIGIFLWVCVMITKDGLPSDFSEQVLVLALFFSPLLNLFVLYSSKIPKTDNFVALYLQRKSLEEKMKIAAILNKDKE